MTAPFARIRTGFTIVELIIVVTIIGILAALTVVAYNGIQASARDKALISDAEGVASEITRYSMKHNGELGAAVTWYSGGSANANIQFTPSAGNVIDVVANTSDYCIRVYNPAATKNNIDNAYQLGSTSTACDSLSASFAAAGAALDCADGFIVVPGNSTFGTSSFCVMKYEARQSGTTAVSTSSGTPWVSKTQPSAVTSAQTACSGCHLITESQWLTIAHNVLNVASNWTGGAVGSGMLYRGHTDSGPASALTASTDNDGYSGTGQTTGEQRRTLTLSNGEVIWDFAGNVWEWTTGETTTGQPGIAAGGYAWREWNALTTPGSLTPNPFPSFGTPSASAWTSSQGIGQAYTNSDETGQHYMARGGAWNSSTLGGVFTLYSAPTSTTGAAYGFRAAK